MIIFILSTLSASSALALALTLKTATNVSTSISDGSIGDFSLDSCPLRSDRDWYCLYTLAEKK